VHGVVPPENEESGSEAVHVLTIHIRGTTREILIALYNTTHQRGVYGSQKALSIRSNDGVCKDSFQKDFELACGILHSIDMNCMGMG